LKSAPVRLGKGNGSYGVRSGLSLLERVAVEFRAVVGDESDGQVIAGDLDDGEPVIESGFI
jgi:hypothetical protein